MFPTRPNFTIPTVLLAVVTFLLCACNPPNARQSTPLQQPIHSVPAQTGSRILVDFEESEPQVSWTDQEPPATTAAATQASTTSTALIRSSLKPNTGLWSLQADLTHAGAITRHFPNPVDFQNCDTLTAAIRHLADPNRSGEWTARVYLIDQGGKKCVGDSFPITTQWQEIPLDLASAIEEGLDASHISELGVEFTKQPNASLEPLLLQTDSWTLKSDFHDYVGTRIGLPKTFYVERRGTRLTVGMVGQYEMTFFDRGGESDNSAPQRPWITLSQGANKTLTLGQPGTGLTLLDQNAYDQLTPFVQQSKAPASDPNLDAHLPNIGWPLQAGSAARWSWQCAWTSPVAAIVEVLEEVGPYNRLGEPAVTLKWRFMIYQWGQVFVHLEWSKNNSSTIADPITWALILNRNAEAPHKSDIQASSAADAERLLSEIYPVAIRQSLSGALPHQLQEDQPVALIAKTGATAGGKSGWWAAEGSERRIFGAAVAQRQGPLDCMLLVNSTSALMQAGSFSTYLIPPKIRLRQGELDRNMPGDIDNDGLVEPYGFQAIRLAHGRASFTIYPQERPLFYPAFLFTVPALERDAMDLPHSRVLINIDGKQFADPPQFPDGSFLLQMPYVIDRPVEVEAILVKK